MLTEDATECRDHVVFMGRQEDSVIALIHVDCPGNREHGGVRHRAVVVCPGLIGCNLVKEDRVRGIERKPAVDCRAKQVIEIVDGKSADGYWVLGGGEVSGFPMFRRQFQCKLRYGNRQDREETDRGQGRPAPLHGPQVEARQDNDEHHGRQHIDAHHPGEGRTSDDGQDGALNRYPLVDPPAEGKQSIDQKQDTHRAQGVLAKVREKGCILR